MCDVCNDKSGGKDVGVAAVPAAPVSVLWCDNCLRNNAVPLFVAETWLFSPFDQFAAMLTVDEELEADSVSVEMPEQPPHEFPLANWAGVMTIWRDGRGYVKLVDLWQELWAIEYKRRQEENDDKPEYRPNDEDDE